MAKDKSTSIVVVNELASARIYKPNQGKLVRQLTAVALGLLLFFGAYTWSQGWLASQDTAIRVGLPAAVAAVGAWLIFRVVNLPRVAEFLISVESEMDKVSWASKHELYRATIVVICTMFFLGAILYVYDLIWYQILSYIRVLRL
jgi:preprotein translocase subunit SecE